LRPTKYDERHCVHRDTHGSRLFGGRYASPRRDADIKGVLRGQKAFPSELPDLPDFPEKYRILKVFPDFFRVPDFFRIIGFLPDFSGFRNFF
jgi:hypothetical protein